MTTTIAPKASWTDHDDAPEIEKRTQEALEAVQEIYDEYIVFPSPEARDAVVLWTAHTHVFYAFESTPRLNIASREPGSGKSRVLELLEHLVPSPLMACYMTPGVMWRSIEHTAPTMLLDEIDTIFGKNGSGSAHRQLRGIINAGHRKGATVPRVHGAEDVKHFRVFSPVAMAGLGTLPDTIATRSIEIRMRKRRDGEEVRPFRLKFAQDALKRARTMLESWSLDASDELEFAAPEMPVKDRAADVWEPIFAVAELAGDEWSQRARRACEELSSGSKSKTRNVSPGVKLLSDLRDVFGDAPVMFTADILSGLFQMDDTPWSALDARKLRNMLVEYGVRPTTVRQGDQVAKGYKAEDLSEPWNRYVPRNEESSEDL